MTKQQGRSWNEVIQDMFAEDDEARAFREEQFRNHGSFPSGRVAHVTGENLSQRPKEIPLILPQGEHVIPKRKRKMKMPVYDDPNHYRYGPCRRLHLILLYLFGDELSQVEQDFIADHDGWDWTKALTVWMDEGRSEARAAKDILSIMLQRFYR